MAPNYIIGGEGKSYQKNSPVGRVNLARHTEMHKYKILLSCYIFLYNIESVVCGLLFPPIPTSPSPRVVVRTL